MAVSLWRAHKTQLIRVLCSQKLLWPTRSPVKCQQDIHIFHFSLHLFAMPRPLVATIDIIALQSNLALARRAMPSSKIWAVVKANAYGHGLASALKGFADADGLSLLEWDVAIQLRESGWTKPILMLEGAFDATDLQIADQHRLQIVVYQDQQIAMLKDAALSSTLSHPIDVHIKINTGMNRLGFPVDRVQSVYALLRSLNCVGKISFMTHFANAENKLSVLSADSQYQQFRLAIQGLDGEISVANSAAVLLHQDMSAEWIRPGVMLYGASPSNSEAAMYGLRPAMTLQSQLMAIQTLQAGEFVGYGSLFKADKTTRVGVVACGYADGYPRHAKAGTPVLVDGQRVPLIGRVSMDMLTVDVTALSNVEVGSQVTLWGEGLAIDEVAAASGTIGYELMCAIAPRVARAEKN